MPLTARRGSDALVMAPRSPTSAGRAGGSQAGTIGPDSPSSWNRHPTCWPRSTDRSMASTATAPRLAPRSNRSRSLVGVRRRDRVARAGGGEAPGAKGVDFAGRQRRERAGLGISGPTPIESRSWRPTGRAASCQRCPSAEVADRLLDRVGPPALDERDAARQTAITTEPSGSQHEAHVRHPRRLSIVDIAKQYATGPHPDAHSLRFSDRKTAR